MRKLKIERDSWTESSFDISARCLFDRFEENYDHQFNLHHWNVWTFQVVFGRVGRLTDPLARSKCVYGLEFQGLELETRRRFTELDTEN